MSSSKGKHYSESQKLYLTELVKERKEIEGKGYDAVVLQKKAKAWEEVAGLYGSRFPEDRMDVKSLQGVWKRIKEKCKKELDNKRKESKKTGGGDNEAELGIVSEQAAAVLGDTIFPLKNQYDNDATEADIVQDYEPECKKAKYDHEQFQLTPLQRKKQNNLCSSKGSIPIAAVDPLIEMARKEHEIKMRIYRLKEWKITNVLMNSAYGLPPFSFISYLNAD